jgi:hypothetical protein
MRDLRSLGPNNWEISFLLLLFYAEVSVSLHFPTLAPCNIIVVSNIKSNWILAFGMLHVVSWNGGSGEIDEGRNAAFVSLRRRAG